MNKVKNFRQVLAILVLGIVLVLPNVANVAAAGTDQFNLSQATIVNAPADVASWPSTANITNVDVSNFITIDFDKRTGTNRWPDQLGGPGIAATDTIQYTLWLFLNINGKWTGSAFVQFWYNRDLSAASKVVSLPCDYYYSNRWSPMYGHQIIKGEQIGFMVTSGNSRNAGVPQFKERSNVVVVTSPVTSVNPSTCPSETPTPPPPTTKPTPSPVPRQPEIAPICDPIPDDPDLILKCNDYANTHPKPKTYAPGTDPANPVVFPADGISGIAAAYTPKNDSVLIVAGKFNSDTNRTLIGIMADAKTLALKGTAFRVDSGGSAGTPKIVYAPDLEKFLVVWEDSRPCGNSCRSEYGRLISAAGAPIGTDFLINSNPAFLSGVTYNSSSHQFAILYESSGAFLSLRTIDADGKVSGQIVAANSFPYQGQAGIAYNQAKDEYWLSYAVTLSGGDTAKEDDRIMFSRVNAKTLSIVGQPIQLSQTRIGRLAVQGAHIADSPAGAMAIWSERGKAGIIGTWGRTISNDATLSDEYPVITTNTNIYSDGFYSSSIEYNPYTDSFFVPSGDQSGNAWITEIDLNGLIYGTEPALQAVAMKPNFFAKLFGIPQAQAAAFGNFNVTAAATPYGAGTFASRNYTSVVGTSNLSGNAPGPAAPAPTPGTPTPTTRTDITALPKLINQIYVWSLGLAVLLALLMIIIGGYYYMTAGGNGEQASKGKEYITSALIGVVVIFCAYLLLYEINPDLVNFNLNSLNDLPNCSVVTTVTGQKCGDSTQPTNTTP